MNREKDPPRDGSEEESHDRRPTAQTGAAALDRLRQRRFIPPPNAPTSEELLREDRER